MPVVINPNKPMSMQDFQQLYTGTGQDPRSAGMDLSMSAPSGGMEYVNQQWNKFGTGQTPEQYFSDPAHLAAAMGAPPPQTMIPGPNGYPIPAGQPAMVPGPNGYPIPAQQLAAQVQAPIQQRQFLQGLQNQSMGDIMQQKAAANPIMPVLGDPAKLAQAQINNDPTGFVKQFLGKQQNNQAASDQSFLTNLNTGANVAPSLKGYIPPMGYGSVPESRAALRLDTNIYQDPDFQKYLARDPNAASYAYRALTGRDMQGDLEADNKTRTDQINFGKGQVQDMIKNDAHYDPETGKLMLWQNVTPQGTPDAAIKMGQVQPVRMRMEASPEQQYYWKTYYQAVTGNPLPTPPQSVIRAQPTAKQAMQDPDVAAAVATKEQQLGRPLNSQEKIDQASKVMFNKASQVGTSGWDRTVNKVGEWMKAAAGYQPSANVGWDTLMGNTQTPEADLNTFGRWMANQNASQTGTQLLQSLRNAVSPSPDVIAAQAGQPQQ